MSEDSERVIKAEGGLFVTEFAGKKFRWNPPVGTLILTNKNVIYAAVKHGLRKQVKGAFLPLGLSQKVLADSTLIKPEELEEAMKNEGSFKISLASIVNLRTHRRLGFGAPFFHITWKTKDGEITVGFAKGTAVRSFKPWVEAIEAAKRREG